jgi:hypothetical protein
MDAFLNFRALFFGLWLLGGAGPAVAQGPLANDVAQLQREVAELQKQHRDFEDKVAKLAPPPAMPLLEKLLWIVLPLALSAGFSAYFSHRFTIRRDQKALARESSKQLFEKRDEIARVLDIALAPADPLPPTDRNRVTEIGDLLDIVASRYLSGDLDRKVFDSEGGKQLIIPTYDAIVASGRFESEVKQWTNLKRYCDEYRDR